MAEKDQGFKVLSDNRQAGHNYFLMDRFEALRAYTKALGDDVQETAH